MKTSKLDEGTINVCICRMCWQCRKGLTPTRQPDGDWWHISLENDEECFAAKLQELLWEETCGL